MNGRPMINDHKAHTVWDKTTVITSKYNFQKQQAMFIKVKSYFQMCPQFYQIKKRVAIYLSCYVVVNETSIQ